MSRSAITEHCNDNSISIDMCSVNIGRFSVVSVYTNESFID